MMLVVKPYANLKMIVCRNRANMIGIDNQLPWKIPKDLVRFKKETTNNIVIMGRKTWESLPKKPLPDRLNIVISSTVNTLKGAQVFRSLNEALSFINESIVPLDSPLAVQDVWIIGGRRLYEEALPYVCTISMTTVADGLDSSSPFLKGKEITRLPEITISLKDWVCVEQENYAVDYQLNPKIGRLWCNYCKYIRWIKRLE